MPGDIYNLPDWEKEFIYQATQLKIDAENKEAEKAKRKGRKGGRR